jgi:hypothetical protein
MGHQSGHPSSKRGPRVLGDYVAKRVAEIDRPRLRGSLLTVRVAVKERLGPCVSIQVMDCSACLTNHVVEYRVSRCEDTMTPLT